MKNNEKNLIFQTVSRLPPPGESAFSFDVDKIVDNPRHGWPSKTEFGAFGCSTTSLRVVLFVSAE